MPNIGPGEIVLLLSLLALVATTTVAFVFHARLVRWLEAPLPPERRHLRTLAPAEPFLTSFKISVMAGVGLALPILLWQLWSFLAPAFEAHSQRIVALFVLFATALLVSGVAFGYYLVLPQALHFLTNYDSHLYSIQIRARDYFSFALLVIAGVGVIFELPVFVLALVRLNVLSTTTLRRNRRLGYFLVFVVEVWLLTTAALQRADDFRQVVVDYAAEAASHGAVYLEGIFSPGLRRGIDCDEMFTGYCDGAQEARELHGVEVRLTPDIPRGYTDDEAETTARYSVAYRDRGVVGLGLGGLEAEYPPELYEPSFAIAREGGLASVPH